MRSHSNIPFLVESHPDMGRPKGYATGDIAPVTGIYRVVHNAHRLPHEVMIRRNDNFPCCAKCCDDVLFDLVHATPDLYQHEGYRIYELPVQDDATEAEATTA